MLFISHSKHDIEVVQRFASELRTVGVPVWFDERDLLPEQKVDETIRIQMLHSDAMMFILSADALKSKYVIEEIDFCHEYSRIAITVLLPSTSEDRIPKPLVDHHHYKLSGDADMKKVVEEILRIKNIKLDYATRRDWVGDQTDNHNIPHLDNSNIIAPSRVDFSSPSTMAKVPHQLPPRKSVFINRTNEINFLDNELSKQHTGTPLLVLDGPQGAGKSRLANEFAHRLKNEYPDGQLYLDFRVLKESQTGSVSEAYREVLLAYGHSPTNIPETFEQRVALYRTTLFDKQVMLILDHVNEPGEVKALIPDAPKSLIIATSDYNMKVLQQDGACEVSVNVFDDAPAYSLLCALVGSEPQSETEKDACNTILSYCAGLPLALELCADQVRDEGIGSYQWLANALENEKTRLRRISGTVSGSLERIFETTYKSLAPEDARAFRLLGLAPPLSTWNQVVAVLGRTEHAARPLIAQLAKQHLIEFETNGERLNINMNELLRLFAREKALSQKIGESESFVGRITGYAAKRAREIDRAISPSRLRVDYFEPAGEPIPDGMTANKIFAIERPFLYAVLDKAVETGDNASVCVIADALWPAMYGNGYNQEIEKVYRIAVEAAEKLDSKRNLSYLLTKHARGLELKGDNTTAMAKIERAIELAESDHDDILVASALGAKASNIRDTMGPQYAIEVYQQARDRYPQTRTRSLAIQDYQMGKCYRMLQNESKAAEFFERALTGFREIDDHLLASRTGYRLAQTLFVMGRAEDARIVAEATIQDASISGERNSEGYALLVLSDLSGQSSERKSYLNSALDAFKQVNNFPQVEIVTQKLLQAI